MKIRIWQAMSVKRLDRAKVYSMQENFVIYRRHNVLFSPSLARRGAVNFQNTLEVNKLFQVIDVRFDQKKGICPPVVRRSLLGHLFNGLLVWPLV